MVRFYNFTFDEHSFRMMNKQPSIKLDKVATKKAMKMNSNQTVMRNSHLNQGRKFLTRGFMLFNLLINKQETTVHDTEQHNIDNSRE